MQRAMLLFWQHGYESTSLTDLTREMGITPPSLYSAFGDKKRLFLEAVALYLSGPVTSASIIEEAPSAEEAAFALLRTSAIGATGTSTPKGCLLASSAISCSDAAADVKAELAALRKSIESQLKRKILADIRTGVLPEDADASALAAHVMALTQGMSTLARDGASREKLLRLVDVAMLVWPGRRVATQKDSR